MRSGTRAGTRGLTVATIVVHLGLVAAYLVVGVASAAMLDPLRPIPIAGVYGAPALLALAGLRGRDPLLLAAGVAAGLLALVPFSLHSFVLAPAAAVYACAYARLTTGRHHRRAVLAVLGCPLLLVAAFLSLVVHEDPACFERLETGEVVLDTDPGGLADTRSDRGTMRDEGGIVEGGVVEAGCTSDTIVPWEVGAALTLSGTAVAAGLLLVPDARQGRPGPGRVPLPARRR